MSLRDGIARRLRDQRGATLVELMVAASVGIVVLGAVYALMDISVKTFTKVEDRVDVSQRGRLAMHEITRQLRSQTCLGTTPSIVDGRDDEVTFYTDLGGETPRYERKRLNYWNNTIEEHTFRGTGTPPSVTFPASADVDRQLVANVEQTPSRAVFRYYAWSGGSPNAPTTQLSTPLSAADRARVVKVAVSFVGRPARNAEDTTLKAGFEGEVFFRNTDPSDSRGPRCS